MIHFRQYFLVITMVTSTNGTPSAIGTLTLFTLTKKHAFTNNNVFHVKYVKMC